MSEVIHHEILFFLLSGLSGILILCGYDQLRVVRRVIPHNGFFQSLEDFFYWTAAGIFCFGVALKGNSGSIRGFSLAAVAFGMWFYYVTLSCWVIKSETFVLRALLFPVKIMSKKTAFLVRKALKKVKKWGTMNRKQKSAKKSRSNHESKKKKKGKQLEGSI